MIVAIQSRKGDGGRGEEKGKAACVAVIVETEMRRPRLSESTDCEQDIFNVYSHALRIVHTSRAAFALGCPWAF
jgi:hypothetical protein